MTLDLQLLGTVRMGLTPTYGGTPQKCLSPYITNKMKVSDKQVMARTLFKASSRLRIGAICGAVTPEVQHRAILSL